MSEEFNFEEALEFKLKEGREEGRMEEREKRVRDILYFIRQGFLSEEKILEYANEIGLPLVNSKRWHLRVRKKVTIYKYNS